MLLPLDFPLTVVVLFAGGDESGFIGSYSVVHPSSSSSNSSSFLSRYSVIEVCFVLFVCAFLFCVFVGIVGLTSAAMEEDDGFSTTFVFTHASASARAEKLFNKNRREKEHLRQIREILSSESSAFARAKGGKDGGKVY